MIPFTLVQSSVFCRDAWMCKSIFATHLAFLLLHADFDLLDARLLQPRRRKRQDRRNAARSPDESRAECHLGRWVSLVFESPRRMEGRRQSQRPPHQFGILSRPLQSWGTGVGDRIFRPLCSAWRNSAQKDCPVDKAPLQTIRQCLARSHLLCKLAGP